MKRMMIIALALVLCVTAVFAQGAKQSAAPAVKKVTLDVMMSFPRFTDQMESYFDQFKAKMLAERGIEVVINLEMPSSCRPGFRRTTRLICSPCTPRRTCPPIRKPAM